jgi:hypothetical protein
MNGINQTSFMILGRIGTKVIIQPYNLQVQVSDYLSLPAKYECGQGADGKVIAFSRGQHPDEWQSFSYDLGANKDRFTVKVVPGDATKMPPEWLLSAQAVQGPDRGFVSGDLAFTFINGKAELSHRQTVHLSAYLPSTLTPTPSVVLIGAVLPGASRSASIALSPAAAGTDSLITSVSVSDPMRMTFELKQEEQAGHYQLTLNFTGSGAGGRTPGEVIIRLHSGEIIHIPYIAAITSPPRKE